MKRVISGLTLIVGIVGLMLCMKGWYLLGSMMLVALGLLGLYEK